MNYVIRASCLTFLYRRVLEKTTVPVDTILSYCHCSMNDRTLLDYIDEFKVQLCSFIVILKHS
jgi:hypothetical protein